MSEFEEKVWGRVQHIFEGPVSVSLLHVKKGGYTSIHRHNERWNGFFALTADLDLVEYEKGWEQNKEGIHVVRRLPLKTFVSFPPGVIHQFWAQSDGVVVEVYWSESGVARLDDIERFSEGGML